MFLTSGVSEPVVIQAAISLIPSTNLIPSITSTLSSFPFSRRQCFGARAQQALQSLGEVAGAVVSFCMWRVLSLN